MHQAQVKLAFAAVAVVHVFAFALQRGVLRKRREESALAVEDQVAAIIDAGVSAENRELHARRVFGQHLLNRLASYRRNVFSDWRSQSSRGGSRLVLILLQLRHFSI